MAINIAKEYIAYTKKNLNKFLKDTLKKYYDTDIAEILIETYICTRYYNYYDMTSKKNSINIGKKLKEKAEELLSLGIDKNKLNYIYYTFNYILYIDDVEDYTSINELANKIIDFRENSLGYKEEDYKKELLTFIKEDKKRKNQFLVNFDNDKIRLKHEKTNIKNVYISELEHEIKIPKIYSNYAINKVENSNIIKEDKSQILYHLVNREILKNIIDGNYQNIYIVEFPICIFEKKEKTNRLLSSINDDTIKNNIILKINYKEYKQNKEKIDDLISNGYKFAIEIDETFENIEKNNIMLNVFTYIISNDIELSILEKEKIIKL